MNVPPAQNTFELESGFLENSGRCWIIDVTGCPDALDARLGKEPRRYGVYCLRHVSLSPTVLREHVAEVDRVALQSSRNGADQ